jgi:DNA-binding MarR family transcriptional regulator
MDAKDIRTLKILEEVEREKSQSQRDLARELNISLGLVNSFIKRLAKKGFLKISTIPKNRIRYILTPKGAAEKSRLTYLYIQHSYKFYKEARQKLRDRYTDFEKIGIRRIVFYGASDLAEIAFVSLQETSLDLVAVVDDEKIGNRFMKHTVMDPGRLNTPIFDKILITSVNSKDAILQKIVGNGISHDYVTEIN